MLSDEWLNPKELVSFFCQSNICYDDLVLAYNN